MRLFSFIVLMSWTPTFIAAQVFQVPEDYRFEVAEDYAQYESDIVKCVAWLVETPMYQDPAKRKEASAFLLKWIMGSPTLKIVINPDIVTFTGSSPELLLVFMGGWAKYAIETEQFDDKVGGNLAGLESVVQFYETNKGVLAKDKSVEKYGKMKKKGKLKEYVDNKI